MHRWRAPKRNGAAISAALALALAGCRASVHVATGPSPVRAARSVPRTTAAHPIAPPPPVAVRPLDPERPTADPAARELLLARASSSAAKLAPSTSPPRVASRALDNTARGEAAEMAASSDVLEAHLDEGERASLPVQIAAGDCVTYVAQGGLGVVELDLFVTRGEGRALEVLAEDASTGPVAVIGGRAGCFRAPEPIAGELQVQARKGSGVVLVRAFRRR